MEKGSSKGSTQKMEKIMDQVTVLHANLDDMTAEELGFAQEMLLEAGALDVYTTAIGMKKNRPGTMLSCICSEEKKDECIDAYFRYTSTLGIRMETMERVIMRRSIETITTEAGDIRVKKSNLGDHSRWKVEYDDLRRIAREKKISLRDAREYLRDAAFPES